jgi:hypothetical protein
VETSGRWNRKKLRLNSQDCRITSQKNAKDDNRRCDQRIFEQIRRSHDWGSGGECGTPQSFNPQIANGEAIHKDQRPSAKATIVLPRFPVVRSKRLRSFVSN